MLKSITIIINVENLSIDIHTTNISSENELVKILAKIIDNKNEEIDKELE